MDIITYIILGIIQGITEPIPVSSSGHIFLFKNLFNTNMFNSLNFEIISNFGSFIAIFIIFYWFVSYMSLSIAADASLLCAISMPGFNTMPRLLRPFIATVSGLSKCNTRT